MNIYYCNVFFKMRLVKYLFRNKMLVSCRYFSYDNNNNNNNNNNHTNNNNINNNNNSYNNISIIYEDNHLLVVCKPHNIAMTNSNNNNNNSNKGLLNQCKEYIKKSKNTKNNIFLGMVHRLDRV